MGKIIAVGGGDLRHLDTLSIDKEIVRLTGKKRPKALFIPTASSDAEGYYTIFEEIYGKMLGCKTDVLYLIRENPTRKEMSEKILSSDLIYVGGGNTLMMLNIWRKNGVDKMLSKAYEKDIVLSGLSAGAICWFRYGLSDSRRFYDPDDTSFIRVKGLNLINLTISPHHIREKHRDQGLINMMERTPGVGLALDDNSAIEIIDGRYRFLISKKDAKAKKVYYSKNKLFIKNIEILDEYRPLQGLLEKA